MKRLTMIVAMLLFTTLLKAQDTLFDLPVLSATLNGKPTLQELTKKRLLSFALFTPAKGSPKLTAWVDEEIATDGELELISKTRHAATQGKLAGYEANYIWSTIDDNGKVAKFGVAFHIIKDPTGDRFILEVKRNENKHVYSGFIKIL